MTHRGFSFGKYFNISKKAACVLRLKKPLGRGNPLSGQRPMIWDLSVHK
jgi:hypothetical protein